jgi:hypothetical protein
MEVYFLGVNYSLLYCYNIFLAICSLVFGFLTIRNLGYDLISSLLFLIISFFGLQLEIWWKLGPAETVGVCLFLLSFYLSTINSEKFSYKFSLVFSILLCSLSKESFTLMIPFFYFINLYKHKDLNGKWTETLYKYKYLNLLIIIFLIELIFIKKIGTNNLGYAGLSNDLSIILNGIWGILSVNIKGFMLLIMLFISLELLFIFIKRSYRANFISFFQKNIFSLISFLLILIPNLLLYAKSGINGRYLLPLMIGIAFFIVTIVYQSSHLFLKSIYVLIVLGFLSTQYSLIKNEILKYNQLGKDINLVTTCLKNNINRGDRILLICDPALNFEESFSLMNYINIELKNKNTFVYKVSIPSNFEPSFFKKLNADWDNLFEHKIVYYPSSIQPNLVFFFNSEMIPQYVNSYPRFNDQYHMILNCIYKKNE